MKMLKNAGSSKDALKLVAEFTFLICAARQDPKLQRPTKVPTHVDRSASCRETCSSCQGSKKGEQIKALNIVCEGSGVAACHPFLEPEASQLLCRMYGRS